MVVGHFRVLPISSYIQYESMPCGAVLAYDINFLIYMGWLLPCKGSTFRDAFVVCMALVAATGCSALLFHEVFALRLVSESTNTTKSSTLSAFNPPEETSSDGSPDSRSKSTDFSETICLFLVNLFVHFCLERFWHMRLEVNGFTTDNCLLMSAFSSIVANCRNGNQYALTLKEVESECQCIYDWIMVAIALSIKRVGQDDDFLNCFHVNAIQKRFMSEDSVSGNFAYGSIQARVEALASAGKFGDQFLGEVNLQHLTELVENARSHVGKFDTFQNTQLPLPFLQLVVIAVNSYLIIVMGTYGQQIYRGLHHGFAASIYFALYCLVLAIFVYRALLLMSVVMDNSLGNHVAGLPVRTLFRTFAKEMKMLISNTIQISRGFSADPHLNITANSTSNSWGDVMVSGERTSDTIAAKDEMLRAAPWTEGSLPRSSERRVAPSLETWSASQPQQKCDQPRMSSRCDTSSLNGAFLSLWRWSRSRNSESSRVAPASLPTMNFPPSPLNHGSGGGDREGAGRAPPRFVGQLSEVEEGLPSSPRGTSDWSNGRGGGVESAKDNVAVGVGALGSLVLPQPQPPDHSTAWNTQSIVRDFDDDDAHETRDEEVVGVDDDVGMRGRHLSSSRAGVTLL